MADDREKAPYSFSGLRADSRFKYRPLVVPRVTRRLETGDYSIQGYEHLMAVERKSLADLYGTLGQQRERFKREIRRLSDLHYGAVVVEADPATIRRGVAGSRLAPKSVWRTCLAWSIRYRVQWWMVESRRAAELTTFRLLELWWRWRHAISEEEEEDEGYGSDGEEKEEKTDEQQQTRRSSKGGGP